MGASPSVQYALACLIVCPLSVQTVFSVLVLSSTSANLSQLVCCRRLFRGDSPRTPPLRPPRWALPSSSSSSFPEARMTQRKMRCHGFTIGPLTGAGALQSAAQVVSAPLVSLLRPLGQRESSNSPLTPLAPPPPMLAVLFSLALTAPNSSAMTSLPVHLHRGGAWSLFQSGPT